MDLHDRIARRRSARDGRRLLTDPDQLSPVTHLSEPIGRGAILEGVLDELEPVFDGLSPDEFAIVGPHGSGKSAIVTALFDALNEQVGRVAGEVPIGTTTRAGSQSAGQTRSRTRTWFVPVDARRVDSPFAFYRTVLSVVSSEPVPSGGVGTDALRERLFERLEGPNRRAVIAIDHADEAEGISAGALEDLLGPVFECVTPVVIARERTRWSGSVVEVPAYQTHELVDVLTERAAAGLTAGALDHESARELASWADGNAHDALAALFAAGTLAANEGADRLESRHLEAGMADVPADGIHLECVLSVSEARQEVLATLLTLEASDRPIRAVAADIAAESSLAVGTVTRFLYELADWGILERVPLESTGRGRRSSGVRPRFPTISFRQLSPQYGGYA